jgi:hypothetical protein
MMPRIGLRQQGVLTMAEMIVVGILSSVVAGALYKVLITQERLYTSERVAAVRHDALRLSATILSADLMEASSSENDFIELEDDELSLRSPVGFGIVCGVDSVSRKISAIGAEGRFSDPAGDSLLIFRADGWLVRAAQVALPVVEAGPGCAYAGGPEAQYTVKVDGDITGVPVGAPIRAFHRWTYRLEEDRGAWWLARDDGTVTHLLAGPFTGDGSGLSFVYLDENGQVTDDPNRLVRLDLTLVSQVPGGIEKRDTLTATVRLRNQ